MKLSLIISKLVYLANGKPAEEDPFAMPDASFFEGHLEARRYVDLHAIVVHYNSEFDHRKFWYYGCHCLMLSDRAMSTRGKGKPVDKLDSLCKDYKECIHCAKQEFGEDCIPEAVKYAWRVDNDEQVQPKNDPGTCRRALFECDKMYATKLNESGAMADFNTDYHGYWTTTGFDHKTDGCPKRAGQSEPECCGGFDTPFTLYNTLNENKKCCDDGYVRKEC